MSEVLRELPSDGVILLRLNRPEHMNALSLRVRELLAAELNAMATDSAVRCVVITGDENVFAAGADVGELAKRKVIDRDEGIKAFEERRKPLFKGR